MRKIINLLHCVKWQSAQDEINWDVLFQLKKKRRAFLKGFVWIWNETIKWQATSDDKRVKQCFLIRCVTSFFCWCWISRYSLLLDFCYSIIYFFFWLYAVINVSNWRFYSKETPNLLFGLLDYLHCLLRDYFVRNVGNWQWGNNKPFFLLDYLHCL